MANPAILMKGMSMSNIWINVKKGDKIGLEEEIVIPKYQTDGSAGADICSNVYMNLPAGKWGIVPTGLFLEIPEGFECQVRSRSGLAAKHGVAVLNSPGTIDADFRGEVKVILINHGKEDFRINQGDRIAQLVFAPVTIAKFICVDKLGDTIRGEGGFGSTGV